MLLPDGEGMPLKAGNFRDFDKYPISRTEIEASRTLYYQVCNTRWQNDTSGDKSLASAHEGVEDSVDELDDPDDQDANEDLVEVWCMDDHESPECPVQQMCTIKNLNFKQL